jgi:hypothetical protein
VGLQTRVGWHGSTFGAVLSFEECSFVLPVVHEVLAASMEQHYVVVAECTMTCSFVLRVVLGVLAASMEQHYVVVAESTMTCSKIHKGGSRIVH